MTMTTSRLAAAAAGQVRIGSRQVNRLGIGGNRLNHNQASRQILRQALELGVQLFDTAQMYQGGASETVIGDTLAPYPDNVIVATKGGATASYSADNSAEYIRRGITASLQHLQLERLPLYYLHRIDPEASLEQTIWLLQQLQAEGRIDQIGLSEASVEQVKVAQGVAPIAAVQNEYNLGNRKYDDVVEYCSEHDIVFVPWSPLGSGTMSQLPLVDKIADKYDATPEQIAVAWLLQRSPQMLPIPGTLSSAHLEANIAAAQIKLSHADFSKLNDINI